MFARHILGMTWYALVCMFPLPISDYQCFSRAHRLINMTRAYRYANEIGSFTKNDDAPFVVAPTKTEAIAAAKAGLQTAAGIYCLLLGLVWMKQYEARAISVIRQNTDVFHYTFTCVTQE